MALKLKYFVLKPEGDTAHAAASRAALRAYAEVISAVDPEFSQNLLEWYSKSVRTVADERILKSKTE